MLVFRVLKMVDLWVSGYWIEDFEKEPELQERLCAFVSEISVTDGEQVNKLARNLERKVNPNRHYI